MYLYIISLSSQLNFTITSGNNLLQMRVPWPLVSHGCCSMLLFFAAVVGQEHYIKQPIQNLRDLSLHFKEDAFRFEWAESGAMVLPSIKTVVCSYPKAGTTTVKWILLALLGYDKSSFCGADNTRDVQFNHNQYISKGMIYLRNLARNRRNKGQRGWDGDYWQGPSTDQDGRVDYNWGVAEMFLDPNWTTIAFVRDPWWRAISMWHHQLTVVKQITKIKDFVYEDRKNFMDFVQVLISTKYVPFISIFKKSHELYPMENAELQF